YLLPLESGVIQKDEGIQSQIELVCKLTQVRRLRTPVDPSRRNVRSAQNHPWVLIDHVPDVGFLVLAYEDDEGATFLDIQDVFLKQPKTATGMLVAQRDSIDAILGHDTTPKCVVAVEGEHLLRRQISAPCEASDRDTKALKEKRRIWGTGHRLVSSIASVLP